MSEFMEHMANWKWNATHPSEWPVPPRKMPRWFNTVGWMAIRDMEEVFGIINQSDLDRFWTTRSHGQSVNEDAGGYLMRCYLALSGAGVEEPYTYGQAVQDILNGS